ncbi:MAG TPA: Eco57I restriction-modification methylase domain-containing protein [Acidisphaera sp.]|nr:Eco57I restriction-modification methylase domain-containing protein [Acidisphaera sp.]
MDEGVRQDSTWLDMPDADVSRFEDAAREHFATLPEGSVLGEAETEQLIVFPVLQALGWSHLPQQKARKRRDDVPDALLFLDQGSQKDALALPAGMQRWKRAAVVNENKAWDLPLDRASGTASRTPASQVLRYLRIGDEQTGGALRWALLCNGRLWRLYWAGASSVADRFLEADLPALLSGAETAEGRAWLKTFLLFFRRDAFAPDADGRSFLLHAMDEGRVWQERVTAGLSRSVFDTVYPTLLEALGVADPARNPADPKWPETIRQSAVVLLYRLLFLLYAEDRDLLPVTHAGYQPRSLRHLRNEVAEAVDSGRPLSNTDTFWWSTLTALFKAIDKGSDAMGLPAYNGGLFDAVEAPLLQAVELPDSALAAILDGLSRRRDGTETRFINYRDLSVQQLGAIYERLLDFDVALDAKGTVALTEDSRARKLRGSFYTPSSLVQLILDATVAPHVAQRRAEFQARSAALRGDRRPRPDRIADLRRADPAEALLGLKVADPAMGSGHFLVTVVDRLADAVLLSMEDAAVIAQADGGVAEYASPLADRIEAERARIEAAARTHGWTYRSEQLDDCHIVRRLVLKRCVYGVDRNRLAVELAKLSLWLHSFTVGAPLSFLDHHLRCGDSLFGAWVADTETITSGKGKARAGGITLHHAIASARGAAAGMARIEEISDADITQVRESLQIFETVEEATAPLRAFLDCWHALLWLPPLKGAAKQDRERVINAWLDGVYGDPVALAEGKEVPAGIPVTARAVQALLTELRGVAQRQRLLHWQPAFPGVWSEWKGTDARGGFDAVVGNPPWVRQEELGAIKAVLKQRFRTYEGTADLSSFFLEQAVRLVRPGGRVGMVLPNKFFKADYGEALRDFLHTETWIEQVVDFGHNRDLFPDADVFPCVLVTRRPAPAEERPENAAVAVIPSDRAQQDRLAVTVAALQFPIALRSLEKDGWVLEPPPVRALMERVRRETPSLVEYSGVQPDRGVVTGFNDAFVVDTATRDQLVAADPNCAPLIRKLLRGQDIERWAADWPGLWLIFTRRGTDIARYPAVRAHLEKFRRELEPKPADWRGDNWQGRKPGSYHWWEIQDNVAYFESFERPKIIYQEIQFHPAYSIDARGHYLNNKGFMIGSADPFLLAALNSPLLWWFAWRFLPHMKDEALSPAGFKMEALPIARPTEVQAEQAADLTPRLADIHDARHEAQRALADWLRVEWGIAQPPSSLTAPFALSADEFAEALRKTLPKKRKLTVAEVAAVKAAHAQTVAPVATRLHEAARLERKLSAIVNAAYGLTAEEEALVWRTAPPRMPIPPPEAGKEPSSSETAA